MAPTGRTAAQAAYPNYSLDAPPHPSGAFPALGGTIILAKHHRHAGLIRFLRFTRVSPAKILAMPRQPSLLPTCRKSVASRHGSSGVRAIKPDAMFAASRRRRDPSARQLNLEYTDESHPYLCRSYRHPGTSTFTQSTARPGSSTASASLSGTTTAIRSKCALCAEPLHK